MTSLTIMIIVIVATLTGFIFCLTWFGFLTWLKTYKQELDTGQHDIDLCKERYNIKDKKGTFNVLGGIITNILLIVILIVLMVGLIFTYNGGIISIHGKTALVIKTGSMSGFYNDNLEQHYEELGYNKDLQYNIGDICLFETTDDLILGEVYAYAYNDVLITHRLIDTYVSESGKTYYVFRGDNNPDSDQKLVSADEILYHYTGYHIPKIGIIVLYMRSYMGLWSLCCILGVLLSFEMITRRIQRLNDERLSMIGGTFNE